MEVLDIHKFSTPIVVISKCLGFEPCRYDGKMIFCDIIDKILPFIDVLPVCPECEIGLGVPRAPIRLVNGKTIRLVQTGTEQDITEKMQNFVNDFLDSLPEIDGFILKSKSPSCGFGNTKVFAFSDASKPLHRYGIGFLAKGIMDRFPGLPYIDEMSLMSPQLQEEFFTKLFLMADFRLHHNSIQELMEFHRRNKLLLMAYDLNKLKILGRILADNKQHLFSENVTNYARIIQEMTSETLLRTNIINAFMHAFGYFSKRLEHSKRHYILDSIEAYRLGNLTLKELRQVMIPCIVEFQVDYLMEQTLFHPYPENLYFSAPETGKI